MSALVLILAIIFVIIILACLWYSFGTGPEVTEQDIQNATGNVPPCNNTTAFMLNRPDNYNQTQPTRAVFTNWQEVKGVSNNGSYTLPKEGANMNTCGKVRFANDVQVGTNKMLPRLNLVCGDKVLNSSELPVKMSRNGNEYYIPAGKYSVDYTGQLNAGERVMFEINAPPSDLNEIMKSALGHEETSFCGMKV